MANFFISTGSMSSAARASVLTGQEQLAQRQKEIATGRIADAGIELGHRSRELVGLRQTLVWSQAIAGSNAIVASRLEASQEALTAIEAIGSGFLNGLLAARGASAGSSQVEAQARTSLTAFVSRLDTEVAGEYVLGGANSSEPPLADYFAASGSAARTSVAQAFQVRFGIDASDPAVAAIAAADMSDFLDNGLASQFADPAWQQSWSRAASDNAIARIGLSETQEVGANANEAPFRQLAMAFVMVADLGGKSLNEETRGVVMEKATELVGSALVGVAATRSRLGLAQERVAAGDERLAAQIDIATRRVSEIEGVDPYAAATELNELMRRLEASYATTARIQRLSLLDYL